VVFDGLPSALSPEMLTRIYGEEDWTALQSRQDREADDERSAGDREAVDDEFERRASLA
jgi:phosphonate transport system ATP-binding protein